MSHVTVSGAWGEKGEVSHVTVSGVRERRETVSHITVSGGWRAKGQGVTCAGF